MIAVWDFILYLPTMEDINAFPNKYKIKGDTTVNAILSNDDVIRARQTELTNEILSIDEEIQRFKMLIEEAEIRKQRRMMEYQILEGIESRSTVTIVTEFNSNRRKATKDRLNFEDTLINIFDNVGRPMSVAEIIEMLGKFGFKWGKYQTAWAYITKCSLVQPTGERGKYNIVRHRGWE
jgi:hypothetical protein